MKCKYCNKSSKIEVCNLCNVRYHIAIENFGVEMMIKNISKITGKYIKDENEMLIEIRRLENEDNFE